MCGTVLKKDGITAILVTHDQIEAFAMADEIGVIGEGTLHQWDVAYELTIALPILWYLNLLALG